MRCNSCKTKIKLNQKFCPECGAEITPKKTLSKKAQAFIACVCCLVLIISGTIGGVYFYYSNNTNNNSDSNYIALAPGFTDVKITDEKSALKAINTVADVIGIENVEEELKISSTNTIDGDTYYRFQQFLNDIPVYGNSLVIVADSNGNAITLTSNYEKNNSNYEFKLSESEAEEIIKNDLSISEDDFYNKGKCIYDSKASYMFIAPFENDKREIVHGEVFISAENGQIFKKSTTKNIDNIEYNKLLSGQKEKQYFDISFDENNYYLLDPKRQIYGYEVDSENYWLLFSKANSTNAIYWDKNSELNKPSAVDAVANVKKAYDYYNNELNYKSPNGKGNCTINVVDGFGFSGDDNYVYDDANCKAYTDENGNDITQINIGKKTLTQKYTLSTYLDVMAHEYTHAVIYFTSHLGGNEESDSLEEAYCDIMGEVIEYSVTNENDWEIGNNIRNIAKTKNNHYSKFNSYKDCHENAQIIGYAAYLMNNGCNGEKEEIGMLELGKLWFGSLLMIQTNATFEQCRNAVELSARIMLKNDELTQEQYNCVQDAFDAVGIENASYSYKYRVKNEFDLKVINDQNTDDVNYNLKIYKMHEDNFDFINYFLIKDRNEEIVLDENSLYGTKKLSLSDGIYKLEITDLDDSNITSAPITTKIIVDGNNEKAVDEITIYTDFSDITTIILNDNNQSETKETTTWAIEESTTESEPIETTENNDLSDNLSAEQLRKNIIGSWGALGSIVPEYNFIDSENCSGEYPWQSSGTYSISDNKTLTISWDGKSESEIYIWSSDTWDEFYSYYEHDVNFWYMTDDDILMLNGKEKYREGVDNFTYNSDGDLMSIISGTWISDKGYKEYQINSDGTWIESTVVVSGATVVNRTQLDDGKVEIIDDTTAKLWQETNSLFQIPGASELIYDSKNDTISVGGTNNTFTRAEYE